MKFVSRREWGARPREAAYDIAGPVRGMALHWEGPHMGYPWPHRECDNKVRSIQNFHMDTRGWSDIAYNALVCPHGYVFEGRGPNRRSAAQGDPANDHWYAICYLGGEGDEFTTSGKQAYRDARQWLMNQGNAGERVTGHRDHMSTECPGDVIYRWLNSTDWTQNEEDDVSQADVLSALESKRGQEALQKALVNKVKWEILNHMFPKWTPGEDEEGDLKYWMHGQQARGVSRATLREFNEYRKNAVRRNQTQVKLLRGLVGQVSDDATRQDLNAAVDELETAIREDEAAIEVSEVILREESPE